MPTSGLCRIFRTEQLVSWSTCASCRHNQSPSRNASNWSFGATPIQWTVLGLRLDFLFAESFRS